MPPKRKAAAPKKQKKAPAPRQKKPRTTVPVRAPTFRNPVGARSGREMFIDRPAVSTKAEDNVYTPRHNVKLVPFGKTAKIEMPSSTSYNIQANERMYELYVSRLKGISKAIPSWSVVWPQSHFTMGCIASRFSGKSVLIDKLCSYHLVSRRFDLEKQKLVRSRKQFFERKILFAPTAFQDESLNHRVFDEVYTTRLDLEKFLAQYYRLPPDKKSDLPSTLIVLDDVHRWLNHEAHSMMDWFVTSNRHYNCSIIAIAQNVKSFAPSMRNNFSDLIMFRCRLDEERKKITAAFGTNFDSYYNIIDWNKKYNFIYMSIRKGPITWIFEGNPVKHREDLMFHERDVTIQLKFLGTDVPTSANSEIEEEIKI